jgi:hypothetical protein
MAKTFYMRSRWKDPLEVLEDEPTLYVSVEAALSGAARGDYIHKLIIQTNHVVVDTPRLGDVVDDS